MAFAAPIYKWVDEEGNVHYGDCPPDDCEAEEIATDAPPSAERVRQAQDIAEQLAGEQQQSRSPKAADVSDGQQVPVRAGAPKCFSSAAAIVGEGRASREQPISIRLLTSSEQDSVARTLRTFAGRHKGTVKETICLGTADNPQIEEKHYETSARGLWRSGSLELESEIYDRNERTQTNELHWWSIDDDKLYFGNENARDKHVRQFEIEVLAIEPDSLVIMRKFQYRAVPVPRLELTSLKASGRVLEINEWFYIRGALHSDRSWTLSR